jgi:hypothetical protein
VARYRESMTKMAVENGYVTTLFTPEEVSAGD